MKMKGKLVKWNDERGFGFIKSDNIKHDVFIHISELKRMSRKPKVSDVIFFDVITEKNGKKRAVNAVIEGVAVKPSQSNVRGRQRKKEKKNFTNIAVVIVFLLIAFGVYKIYYNHKSVQGTSSTILNFFEEDFSGFTCEGKHYCSEMTSCKEARFYLKNCPDTEMDGDNDGVPCERQWCN